MFVDLVREEFERRGITLTEATPFNVKEPDSFFSYRGEAMTDAGYLEIGLYDWLHTRFALPDVASQAVNCNPYSGKFNFNLEREGFGNEQYTREFVNMIFVYLDRVNVRPWEITYKRITTEELAARPLDDWIKDQKMGCVYMIDGFDKHQVAKQIADESCSHSSIEIRTFTENTLQSRSDVEVMKILREREEEKASAVNHTASSSPESQAQSPVGFH